MWPASLAEIVQGKKDRQTVENAGSTAALKYSWTIPQRADLGITIRLSGSAPRALKTRVRMDVCAQMLQEGGHCQPRRGETHRWPRRGMKRSPRSTWLETEVSVFNEPVTSRLLCGSVSIAPCNEQVRQDRKQISGCQGFRGKMERYH